MQEDYSGLHIGPYTLEKKIGSGAHGQVFLARSSADSRLFAVKLIERQGSVNRFLIEPQILSRLKHPGIVRLYDYIVDGSRVALVMELVEGVSLEGFIQKNGPMSSSEVRNFLEQMAGSLCHAHSLNILHRDIKPSNILVSNNTKKRYILADFGISLTYQELNCSIRKGGTYKFMAPEQLCGRPTLQSDLWSVGVIAYWLLTGKLPFGGQTIEEITHSIRHLSPAPPSHIIKCDSDVETIILDLLEKPLSIRTPSAEALSRMLGLSQPDYIIADDQYDIWGSNEKKLEEECRTQAQKCMWFLLLSALPTGIVGEFLVVCAMWLFFYSQTAIMTSLAKILIVSLSYFAAILGWGLALLGVYRILLWIDPIDMGPIYLVQLCALLCFWIGVYRIGHIRRAWRRVSLLRAIRKNQEPGEQLYALKQLVDLYPTDIVIRQRYAEALLWWGFTKEAVVEGKTILCMDPYNIDSTFLVAFGYQQLGLWELCEQVCDGYLSVSPHSFEFEELRRTCKGENSAISG